MPSEEQIQSQLVQLQNSIFSKMQILRTLTNNEDKWILQEINVRKNSNNGQLIYPKYDRKTSYYQQFWKIYLLNQIFISKVKDFSNTNKSLSQQIDQVDQLQKQWSKIWALKTKKKVRRTSDMIQKNFICPFEKCKKNYGSDVALNMHMKLKHNSGTKTQRELLAKQICLAQERGQKIKIDLIFPPGYLEQFRENFKREVQ